MPKVNVGIICGDSRDRLTEQCFASFFAHTDMQLCDLTVLANAVGEPTARVLERWLDDRGTMAEHHESLGGGAVTNRLLEAAHRNQGDFLYHTASDFYFRPGWLEALLANWPVAEACGVGLLGAYSHPYHRTTAVVKGVRGCDIHMKDAVAGGSWFMPWAVWDRFGPLNELHHGNWVGSEDTEFNYRLIAAGVGRATLVPEGVVHAGRTASNGQPTLGAEYMPDMEGVLIE